MQKKFRYPKKQIQNNNYKQLFKVNNKIIKTSIISSKNIHLLDVISRKLTFNSKLVNSPIQKNIILSLFNDVNISLNQIHY